jgi:small subunit ribosomal protein S11
MAKDTKNTKEKVEKKVVKKVVTTGNGRIYVSTTFNNTLITLTNEKGDAIAWSSSGNMGFKGTRKSTSFAAGQAVEKAIQKGRDVGINSVEVFIKGPGVGRDAALRAIRNSGMSIAMIADITPIPHNGPRGKKKRRV